MPVPRMAKYFLRYVLVWLLPVVAVLAMVLIVHAWGQYSGSCYDNRFKVSTGPQSCSFLEYLRIDRFPRGVPWLLLVVPLVWSALSGAFFGFRYAAAAGQSELARWGVAIVYTVAANIIVLYLIWFANSLLLWSMKLGEAFAPPLLGLLVLMPQAVLIPIPRLVLLIVQRGRKTGITNESGARGSRRR